METKQAENKKYLSILSDGKFYQEVPEGTEGAVVRDIQEDDGSITKKTELVFTEVSGIITNIEFFEGKFGKNIQVELDGDGVISVSTKTDFGEALLKKIPSLDLLKRVVFSPFPDHVRNGKDYRRGIVLTQDGEKINSYYYDRDKEERINGVPEVEGDTSSFDADDWVGHYTKVRKFMIQQIEENIITKFNG